jgi:hypothetical protein
MRWVGDIESMGEMRNLERRDHSEDLGVDGRKILERIL